MRDAIRIEELELSTRIGVPDTERAMPQRLTAHLLLEPEHSFDRLGDDLANAVDYFVISQDVQELARERPRQLVETLAAEIAQMLLTRFPLAAAEVEVRKYILAGTAFVAVKLRREKLR
jgi:FolB domain-containing protein